MGSLNNKLSVGAAILESKEQGDLDEVVPYPSSVNIRKLKGLPELLSKKEQEKDPYNGKAL